jgi:hypothetical protein
LTDISCTYFLSADKLIAFGLVVDKKIIPDVGQALIDLKAKKILKDYSYCLSADLKGPEIILICYCDE